MTVSLFLPRFNPAGSWCTLMFEYSRRNSRAEDGLRLIRDLLANAKRVRQIQGIVNSLVPANGSVCSLTPHHWINPSGQTDVEKPDLILWSACVKGTKDRCRHFLSNWTWMCNSLLLSLDGSKHKEMFCSALVRQVKMNRGGTFRNNSRQGRWRCPN